MNYYYFNCIGYYIVLLINILGVLDMRSKIKRERREYWNSLSWNERIMIIIFLFVIWFGWGQFQI